MMYCGIIAWAETMKNVHHMFDGPVSTISFFVVDESGVEDMSNGRERGKKQKNKHL